MNQNEFNELAHRLTNCNGLPFNEIPELVKPTFANIYEAFEYEFKTLFSTDSLEKSIKYLEDQFGVIDEKIFLDVPADFGAIKKSFENKTELFTYFSNNKNIEKTAKKLALEILKDEKVKINGTHFSNQNKILIYPHCKDKIKTASHELGHAQITQNSEQNRTSRHSDPIIFTEKSKMRMMEDDMFKVTNEGYAEYFAAMLETERINSGEISGNNSEIILMKNDINLHKKFKTYYHLTDEYTKQTAGLHLMLETFPNWSSQSYEEKIRRIDLTFYNLPTRDEVINLFNNPKAYGIRLGFLPKETFIEKTMRLIGNKLKQKAPF